MKEFTGGIILKEQKGERISPAENTNKNQWQGELDREESLSDRRCHKRPPNKTRNNQSP